MVDDTTRFCRALRLGAEAVGVPLDAAAEAAARRHLALLKRWMGRVRLVGSVEPEVVAVRHWADALLVVRALRGLRSGERVVDIGSGAGFPGIPLAVVRGDLEVVLVEPDRRKAAFLAVARAELGLDRMRVVTARAEGRPEAEGIPVGDAVVSRAFRAMEAWVPLAVSYTRPAGRVVAMLAGQVARDRLEAVGRRVGAVLEETLEADLPRGGGPRQVTTWRVGG